MSSYYEKILATGEVKCIDEEIPFEIPATWEWCRLTSLCTRFSTGPFGTMVHKTDYVDDGIPLVNPTNIKNNSISDIGICRVSLSKYNELLSYVLQKNDILLARRGDLSKCAIVSEQHEGWLIGTGSFYLHLNGIDEHFFMMIYVSPYVQTYLIGDSIGTTMNNLNQGLLSQLLVPVPPYKEQKRIFERYTSVLPLTNIYEKRYQDKKLLDLNIYYLFKKSILQEAIQGKLVPQDPSDEPASILLQRIREEKLRLVKEGKLKKKDVIESTIFRGDDNKYYEQIGSDIYDITDNIPFDIPVNWNWCRLKDVVSIFTGATFKKEDASTGSKGVRVLRGGNISPFELVMKPDDLFLPCTKIKESILLRKNDIVTPAVTSLENIGKAARVQKDLNDVTVGGFVFILRSFLCNDLLSQYLFALLGSPTMGEYMKSVTNKSGQAFYNIGKERLAMAMIPLPPIKEQQRIVAQIERLFEQLK